MAKLLIGLVQLYRLILSPIIGMHCRFQPTCSQYMIDALSQYGALRGTWLGVCRLLRCHPWQKGGFDPVPELKTKNHNG